MFTAIARLTLRIPMSASLKDKRQVVRSVLAKVRNQFEVAAAEVAEQNVQNLAVLGLAYVSGEAGHASDMIDRAIRYIEQSRPDVEITDVQQDVVTIGD
jgi:uncharacterized protein YlxP (DUF503 family)